MRRVYLKILTDDQEHITAYGTFRRAKDALREDMEQLLNNEQLAFSEEEKRKYRDIFKRTSSYSIPYVPRYNDDCDYVQYGEIIAEEIL